MEVLFEGVVKTLSTFFFFWTHAGHVAVAAGGGFKVKYSLHSNHSNLALHLHQSKISHICAE